MIHLETALERETARALVAIADRYREQSLVSTLARKPELALEAAHKAEAIKEALGLMRETARRLEKNG